MTALAAGNVGEDLSPAAIAKRRIKLHPGRSPTRQATGGLPAF